MWTDHELLATWRSGDASAGDSLARRHYEPVRRFFDLKVPSVSEDLTQQTFLACLEAQQRLRKEASFKAFLFGIARNLLFRHLRDNERFARMSEFRRAQGPDTALTPTGLVALRQEQRVLLQAFDALSDDHRIAIQLHYWEGMSHAEIGVVLEVATPTVGTRLHRARERLREVIGAADARATVRASLLEDLEGWTRGLAGR